MNPFDISISLASYVVSFLLITLGLRLFRIETIKINKIILFVILSGFLLSFFNWLHKPILEFGSIIFPGPPEMNYSAGIFVVIVRLLFDILVLFLLIKYLLTLTRSKLWLMLIYLLVISRVLGSITQILVINYVSGLPLFAIFNRDIFTSFLIFLF